MHGHGPDVVGVGVKLMQALERVVVEDTDFHVVGPGQHPILARHELSSAYWQVAHFERLHDLLWGREKRGEKKKYRKRKKKEQHQ